MLLPSKPDSVYEDWTVALEAVSSVVFSPTRMRCLEMHVD